MTGKLDRAPAPDVARTRVAQIVEAAVGDEARTLLPALTEEIRQVLAYEHEDDLERARVRSFDLGVRVVLRILLERDAITSEDEERLARSLAAQSFPEGPLAAFVAQVPRAS